LRDGRFGSLAAPLVNISPMSASERKADVRFEQKPIFDRPLTANSRPSQSTENQSIAECQVGRFRLLGHDGFEDDVI